MWQFEVCGFDFYFVFYCFFIFSFLGWIYETTLVSIRQKQYVNRGFLNGPIIPIYGAGGTLVYILLKPITKQWYYIFFLGMVLATILEYITSYVMEQTFHAKWWDYSNHKFNIKGRVCLIASFLWGILSIIDLFLFGPFIEHIIGYIPRWLGEYMGYVLIILFISDFVVTVIYTLQMNEILENLQKLREEIVVYLEGTSLYGKSEGIRERIRNSSLETIMLHWKDGIEEAIRKYEVRLQQEDQENKEEKVRRLRSDIADRMNHFMNRYHGKLQMGKGIHKRLLKAFPNMKVGKRQFALRDLRERFQKYKK